jgi:hypothetical protein
MVKTFIQNEEGDLIKLIDIGQVIPFMLILECKLNGVGLWKIYYPYRKVNRFTANYAFIYGHTLSLVQLNHN